MQFNSVRGNNNVAAGQAAANTVANVYDTSRKTAPDFTKIAKTSIESRSAERVAATRAETQVARQGIASNALIKGTKAKVDSAKKINKTLGGAKRFAGIVGGLGTIATAGIMGNQAAKEAAEDKAANDRFYDFTAGILAQGQQDVEDTIAEIKALRPGEFDPSTYQSPGQLTYNPDDGTYSFVLNSGGDTPNSSDTHVPVTHSPSTKLTQQQGTQLLIDQGMDPENARIGGAVMMAESAGDPGALNSNNEYSLGLWQHNRDTGEDRRNFYGISNWSELSDPETNARATYRLWQRQGGWTPWGAYTNGSYRQFLQ